VCHLPVLFCSAGASPSHHASILFFSHPRLDSFSVVVKIWIW
jgi:hypothetical protein